MSTDLHERPLDLPDPTISVDELIEGTPLEDTKRSSVNTQLHRMVDYGVLSPTNPHPGSGGGERSGWTIACRRDLLFAHRAYELVPGMTWRLLGECLTHARSTEIPRRNWWAIGWRDGQPEVFANAHIVGMLLLRAGSVIAMRYR